MRTSVLFLMICICSCTSIKYHIQEGYYEEAFDRSLRKLENFKKVKYLDLASICLDSLNHRSIQKLQELYKLPDEAKWGEIFWELVKVDERQDKMRSHAPKGIQIAVMMMDTRQPKDLARLNAANYHYQQAHQLSTLALINADMRIAREAFQEFELSSQYIYNFQHSDTLKDLMHEIGTQYILITSNDPYWQDLLENDLNFPFTLGWNLIDTDKGTGPDIEIILTETDLYISGDESSSSTCSQSFQVEDGVEIKKVWSEKDSAYVEIREQKYKTATGQVVTHEQSKSAQICVELYWFDNQINRQIFVENICASYNWSNQYSESSGDFEATSRCTNYGGGCSIYPSEEDMENQVTQAMLELLIQHLELQLSELKY